jgi:rfaE bifunctional protein kinase chain/domain
MSDLTRHVRETFPGKRIVIAGDLVADQFLKGTISRVSREAPVFILRHDETTTVPGGAANAAMSVAALGGQPVLIGVVGKDATGRKLLDALQNAGVDCSNVIETDQVATTTKVRVLAGQHFAVRQQVIRIDYEPAQPIDGDLAATMSESVKSAAASANALIISDYNYGVATVQLADAAANASRSSSIPLVIDSRFRLRDFHGATSATPNQDEVEQILGKDFSPDDCERLRKELNYRSLLITCGNAGMRLFEEGQAVQTFDAVGASEPVDVTGAGDTVIAVYTLGLASGLSFSDASIVANHAGGLVVMKPGTASVTMPELLESLGEADGK